jgi:MFS family permease
MTPSDTPDAAPARQATLWHAFLIMSTVICGTLPLMIGPVLPMMQRAFASTPHVATLVMVTVTVPSLVMALMGFFAGALSDWAGRKRLLFYGLIAYGIAGVLPLFLQDLHQIVASRVLVGVAEAAVMTSATALMGDLFSGGQRQRMLSLQVMIASISGILSNLAGGFLGAYGWRAPFAVYAITIVLVPLVHLFLWEPARHVAAHRTSAGAAADPAARLKPAVLAAIIAVALIGGVGMMVGVLNLSFIMTDLGVGAPAKIGLAYALSNVGVVAGTLVFGWIIAPRFGPLGYFSICALLGGGGFLIMGLGGTASLVILGGLVSGLGFGIMMPASMVWALGIIPTASRGFGIGAFMGARAMGTFISPFVTLPLIGLLHSRLAMISACGAVVLGMGLVLALAAARTRLTPAAPAAHR